LSPELGQALRSLLEAIEHRKNQNSEHRIYQRGEQFARPTPMQRDSDQPAGDGKVDDFVHHIKEEDDEETGAGILDVNLDAEGGSSISHNRIGDAKDTEWQGRRESILQNADCRAGEHAGNLASSRDRQKDYDEQR